MNGEWKELDESKCEWKELSLPDSVSLSLSALPIIPETASTLSHSYFFHSSPSITIIKSPEHPSKIIKNQSFPQTSIVLNQTTTYKPPLLHLIPSKWIPALAVVAPLAPAVVAPPVA